MAPPRPDQAVAGGCRKCLHCYRCGCLCRRNPALIAKAKQIRAQFKERTSELKEEEGVWRNAAGITFHKSAKNEFSTNPLRRFLSCEIEIAGLSSEVRAWKKQAMPLALGIKTLPINEIVEKWGAQLMEDISLPNLGFEISTAPANGDKLQDQIFEICAVLAKFGATVENIYDPRKRVHPCGLHIHSDARDFSYYDLRRFLFLYEALEPVLFTMLPGERRASHYALPCAERYANALRAGKSLKPERKQTSPIKKLVLSEVYRAAEPNRESKRSCPQETRYRALNLHSWFYRNTLEFRHFPGTVDPIEIFHTALLVGGIVNFAYVRSEADILKLVSFMKNYTPEKAVNLLMQTAPTKGTQDYILELLNKHGRGGKGYESPLLGDTPEWQNRMAEEDRNPNRAAFTIQNATFTANTLNWMPTATDTGQVMFRMGTDGNPVRIDPPEPPVDDPEFINALDELRQVAARRAIKQRIAAARAEEAERRRRNL